MTKMIFVSLPVADVAASAAFYEAIGFTRNQAFSNASAAAMIWSDAIHIMLMSRDFYATFTSKAIIDARTMSGALYALSFEDRAGVDAFTEAALAAGARELHGPEDEGYMYSRAFEDPDGHAFGPMWMDAAAVPSAHAG